MRKSFLLLALAGIAGTSTAHAAFERCVTEHQSIAKALVKCAPGIAAKDVSLHGFDCTHFSISTSSADQGVCWERTLKDAGLKNTKGKALVVEVKIK